MKSLTDYAKNIKNPYLLLAGVTLSCMSLVYMGYLTGAFLARHF